MKNIYRIAGQNIAIESIHQDVQDYCSEYLAENAAPDFSVSISQQDIDFSRSKVKYDHPYTDAYLERLTVLRKISEVMPKFNTVLMHGSVLCVDGQAYMFSAASGTGKSTHARLWREMLGEKVIMINDDKPFVRISGGRAEVFGTPWDGKHRLSTNTFATLKAICILERSEQNHISRIPPHDIYPMMIQQIYRPIDRAMFAKTLALIDELMASTEFYRLGCNMDIQAAALAYNTMK